MHDPAPDGQTTASHGVLVLTPRLEAITFNQEAQEFCRRLIEERRDTGVPAPIRALCQTLLDRLSSGRGEPHLQQVLVHRFAASPTALVLHALAIPHERGDGEPIVLIVLMEEVAVEALAELREAQERFKLTERELHVAEHLARGLTNKEIASTLAITEQTVKQHLKHLMVKTRTSTRTGVLARLLGPGPLDPRRADHPSRLF